MVIPFFNFDVVYQRVDFLFVVFATQTTDILVIVHLDQLLVFLVDDDSMAEDVIIVHEAVLKSQASLLVESELPAFHPDLDNFSVSVALECLTFHH